MSVINQTEEQNRKEIIEILNQNVFVEAGAGAGKTTLIVNRIINQLKSGVLPQEIVVITFTNAAAEELRGRITEKVLKSCQDNTFSQAERDRLVAASKVIDLMNISTIHSFCFKLLQERIFDAGLSMDIALMENDVAEREKKKCFTKWSSTLSKTQWNELISTGEDKKKIIGIIERFFLQICELPKDTNINNIPCVLDEGVVARAQQLINDFENMLCTNLNRLLNTSYAKINDIPIDYLTAPGKSVREEYIKSGNTFDAILAEIIKPSKNKTKYYKVKELEFAEGMTEEDAKTYDAKCREWGEVIFNQEIKELIDKAKDYKFSLFLNYAIEARKYYRNNRSNNYISNDDLLQKTHKLICDSDSAREYFANKFKCIYVDEFQDTDNIQEEFIWALATNGDGSGLRDGALFLVGDPKQSIYRFRGAQPEVYFATKAKMEKISNGKVYCLDYNFRSNEKIVGWVNSEFKNKEICLENAYRDMLHQKELPKKPSSNMLAGVYFYKDTVNIGSDISEDSQKLKDLIYKLVNEKYFICDYDNGVPYERRIKYSDFLVLCYSKANMDKYVEAMSESGIPTQLYGKMELADNSALITFARLFDYLTHPYNRMKKIGAIECLEKNKTQGEKVANWLKKETYGMSEEGIAGYLRRNLELLIPHDKAITASEIQSVQRKVNQMVEYVLNNQASGEASMGKLFWEYSNSELEREISLEPDNDEVRFMNVHKAKGLEGNIVILAKRSEAQVFKWPPYRNGNDFYPSYNYDRTRWTSYEKNEKISNAACAEDERESTRLEYVLATRAKQVFIVMDAIKEAAIMSSYKVMQEDKKNSVKGIIDKPMASAYTPPAQRTLASADTSIVPQLCLSGCKQDDAVYVKKKPSDFEEKSTAKSKALADILPEDRKLSRRPKGNIFGDTMHRCFQLFINRRLINKNVDECMSISIRQAMNQNTDMIPGVDIAAYQEYLRKMLEALEKWATDNGLYEGNKTIYTELPFSYYEERSKEQPAIWMNGYSDLIVKDEQGKFTVYDYKSDRDTNLTREVFETALKEQYQGQLRQYRYAVSKIFGVAAKDVEIKLISFSGDEELELMVVDLK